MTDDATEWMFLGVRATRLTAAQAPVVVMELVLPTGAAPALHIHDDLDDSLYVLEGTLVTRCGDAVNVVTRGTWAQHPRGVPHQFRVVDGPAHVLQVHSNESFMGFIRAVGNPIDDAEKEPGPAEVEQAMAENGIRVVGPPMEADEAASWMRRLRKDAA